MTHAGGAARVEHRQEDCTARLDRGRTGAAAISEAVDVVVVVDVLSFTTTVSVAVDAGIEVIPCRWGDERAAASDAEHDAVLAVGRSAARGARGPGGSISLSPASARAAVDAGTAPRRVVAPSPNGSTIAADVAASGAVCIAGCLCIAGAVLDALVTAGWDDLPPEATSARAGYLAVREDVGAALLVSASGRELVAQGFDHDVAIAAQVGPATSVPVLGERGFTAASEG